MSLCRIHNVHFYKPTARSISVMALRKTDNKLAIARSDGSIEIWDVNYNPFIEKTIAPTVTNSSIEDLVWCGDRLFSVGLHGFLVEYNLYKLCVKRKLVVTGESAHCLDASIKNQIAIGTEQGYLNIFSVIQDEDEVMFDKFLDKQEGRIISIQFCASGDFVVTGSLDAIRIWSVETGHALHKMTTGRSENRTPTIVWCLKVTNDFTIISGDSRGRLTFWDGKLGAQIESYQTHRADILSICLSDDQNSLYCSGADPAISSHVKVNVKDGTEKWVRSIQRKIHDHDVKSLVLVNGKLFSGGVDGYLACSYHPPKTLLKYPPIMQNSCTVVSPEARLILLKHPKYLEIWRLGEGGEISENFRGLVPLKSGPKKLMVLQRVVKNEDGQKLREGINCSSISKNGNWIFYSTSLGSRLLRLCHDLEEPEFKKVSFEYEDVACVEATFSSDSAQLIVAPSTGGLRVYDLEKDAVIKSQYLQFNNEDLKDTIVHLTVSSCSKYLAVADTQSNIYIFAMKNEGWRIYCKMPMYGAPITALAIHPTQFNIVAVYSDNKIVEYNIKKREFTPFSRTLQHNIPKQFLQRTYPIRNITFDTSNENIILLHDDSTIIIINKAKDVPQPDAKIPKLDSLHHTKNRPGFYSIAKYKHLVNLSWLSDSELVAVEVNPIHLVEKLPPAFVQNTFGRK